MKIALISMPMVDVNIPSLALTQLKLKEIMREERKHHR
jgi:hypothetical protein